MVRSSGASNSFDMDLIDPGFYDAKLGPFNLPELGEPPRGQHYLTCGSCLDPTHPHQASVSCLDPARIAPDVKAGAFFGLGDLPFPGA